MHAHIHTHTHTYIQTHTHMYTHSMSLIRHGTYMHMDMHRPGKTKPPTLPGSPDLKSKPRARNGVGYNSNNVMVCSLPLPQDIMRASTGKQPGSGHLSAAETAAMTNTFRSGVRHTGVWVCMSERVCACVCVCVCACVCV